MKALLRRLVKIFGWNSGSAFWSGMALGTVVAVVAFIGAWLLAWALHFAAEFISFLPWPKGV